ELGTNPGRIISAWRQFVFDHRDDPHLRGIGEPVWPERTPEELVECQHHERLLNVAFPPGLPWRLLCPYDVSTLDAAVVDEAKAAHPYVHEQAGWWDDAPAGRAVDPGRPLDEPLADLPPPVRELGFDAVSRADALTAVAEVAGPGLAPARADALGRAVGEVFDNSLRHGGGSGTLRLWRTGPDVVCEVRDAGRLRDPLVGRGLRARATADRRGLWLVHELCDLVQVRSTDAGTVVRLTMRGAPGRRG
ncbi:MAG: sensor histidine kinase, partial [Actinomycetota bacterium]|nr:sensor histidine kinase [Actinomycetota bacterium]